MKLFTSSLFTKHIIVASLTLAGLTSPGPNQFGSAPLRTGRRILELGLRFDF